MLREPTTLKRMLLGLGIAALALYLAAQIGGV